MANKTIGGSSTSTSTPLVVTTNVDPVNDLLAIYTANVQATQAISRNNYLQILGNPLGNTDTQSVSNKTLGNTNTVTVKDTLFTLQDDGDVTKQARFQLSSITTGLTRTYRLPDVNDTLVTLTAAQTLTNKTLTTPAVDTIVGAAAATSGTLYGISIASSVITTNNSVAGAALTNTSVTPSKLSTGAQAALVATSETTASTAYTDLTTTTDSVTVTVGANGLLLVSYYVNMFNSTTQNTFVTFSLSGANTQAANDNYSLSMYGTAQYNIGTTVLVTGLSAGSTTVKMKYRVSGGTGTFLNRRISVVPL